MKNIGRWCIGTLLTCSWTIAMAADDMPRKSGDWEITVTVNGQSPSVSKVCIDAASDGVAVAAGGSAAQSDCEQAAVGATSDGFTIASICKQGNSTVSTNGTFTGNLESAYEGEIVKNYSPPLYGRTEIKSTVTARYLGACS